MNTASLRSPMVRRAIEAINTGNFDEFMALFTPDATVVDESTYVGHDAMLGLARAVYISKPLSLLLWCHLYDRAC
jgi:hypothetical protein